MTEWIKMRNETDNKKMKETKSNVKITCSNVGIKAGSQQCNFCVLKNKCGALKIVENKKRVLKFCFHRLIRERWYI